MKAKSLDGMEIYEGHVETKEDAELFVEKILLFKKKIVIVKMVLLDHPPDVVLANPTARREANLQVADGVLQIA